ncbi:MAG TPA: hypothetical protein DCK95_06110 [Anaerolineaceae bacterium]|nr:hypothetical protein [Anaerolineaceae bacterium]
MAEISEDNKKGNMVEPKAKVVSDKVALVQEVEKMKATQLELFHKKTHQDMINAAYKAADKLGIAPWVLIRAAGWGHFTDDRGALYKGDHIADIDTLTEEQKEALMGVFGMMSGWEKMKKVK